MPTVHGLEFSYSLYLLPPGRMPFRRWRWELWHGPQLVAAGWRLGRPEAGRALRVYAAEHGHKLFGLPVPPRWMMLATERLSIRIISSSIRPWKPRITP